MDSYGGLGIGWFEDCGGEIVDDGVVPQPEFWSGFPWAHAYWHKKTSHENLQQANLQIWSVPECKASKNLLNFL